MLIRVAGGVLVLVLGKALHWHLTKKNDDDDDDDDDDDLDGEGPAGIQDLRNYRHMVRVTTFELYALCVG